MHKAFETTFGSYQVQEIVGEGGSGRVFKVANADGQIYAVKCLDADKVNQQKLKRFKNELYFCLHNTHVNIVRVYDYGTTTLRRKECPFYVMRYYPATLRVLIGGGIAHERIPQYFLQILEATQVAHRQGIWHRDLKPENVLYDSHSDLLIVADFGIAHFCEELLQTSIGTRPHDRLANFRYAAPEQRTKGLAVDEKADIYALGLMLNEMFTGEVPQGTNYKTIASVAPDFAHLDKLVDIMIRQSSNERPSIDVVIQSLTKSSSMSHQLGQATYLSDEDQTAEEVVLLSADREQIQATWDEEWLARNEAIATAGLEEMELPGSMEIWFALPNHKLRVQQRELLIAAEYAQIHAFGWPIGVVLDRPKHKPRPTADGIVAEIAIKDFPWIFGKRDSYDYWTLRTNGDFYLLKSIFEDERQWKNKGEVLLFDVRIKRIAETLLYCTRLYSHLGIEPASSVQITIKHNGLRGRGLLAESGERTFIELAPRIPSCVEDKIERAYQMTLTSIEANLVNAVKLFAQPLFMLFDFQEFHDGVYREVIDEYTQRIT